MRCSTSGSAPTANQEATGPPPAGVLLESTESIAGWYERFAASLVGSAAVPEPLAPDESADRRLVEAVRRDLQDQDGRAGSVAARIIWTGDHLDAARRLQTVLVGAAQTGTQPLPGAVRGFVR